MLSDYYSLTKSGLVFGNLIPFIAGFALGSRVGMVGFNLPLFIIAAIGIALVMASGCVLNNYLDSDVDGSMSRTKNRALVARPRRISPRAALAFGTALGALGFLALVLFTNAIAVSAALVGFFFYVFMYSAWFKRRSVWGTVVGAVAGATPPVVGYAAASSAAAAGHLDTAALILFAIIFLWQMPHFYSIAIRRRDDYAAAAIPVLPVKHGARAAKIQMALYIAAFTVVAPLLAVFSPLGWIYVIISLALGAGWLVLSLKGFRTHNEKAEKLWARKMFFTSLFVMVVLFATIAMGSMLRSVFSKIRTHFITNF